MKLSSVYCYLLLATVCTLARADNGDTRLLLDENARQIQQYRQSSWRQTDAVAEDNTLITINSQTYRVGGGEAELARGIYYALNFQQWDKAVQFLARYRKLPEHKRELVLMSTALLARRNGDYRTALQTMRTAQEIAPNDVRIQLELARLYAEDNQNREAQYGFQAVLQTPLPIETRQVVRGYLNEIKRRRQWHGNLSIGTGYNDNINQANGEQQCVWQTAADCLMYRNLPQPLASTLFNYRAVASKMLPARGNHHLQLRGLAYGTHYRRNNGQNPIALDYGSHTAALYAGYDYASAYNQLSLLPYFEYDYRNRHPHYRAWGVDANWTRNLHPRWRISLNGGGKRFAYSGKNKAYFNNYTQYNAGIGVEHTLSAQAGWFANLDFYRKKYPHATANNKEVSIRAGAYNVFDNGIYVNAMAQHRYSRYDDGSVMLTDGVRRQDRQTLLLAAVGARRWQYKGIYPELRWKRILNRSNSAFYRYAQNEISLNLKYSF